MTNWTITPLDLGTVTTSKALGVRLMGFDVIVKMPVIGWLLRDGVHNVLVDSGPCDIETGNKYHRALTRTDAQYLEPALARQGLAPGDIDTVINTHLHWDHCMGNNDLPRARIIVQRSEIMYAAWPFPSDKRAYEADLGFVYFNSFYSRIIAVEGDMDLMPGLRLLHTPGHTPGSQSVVVQTTGGPHVITGDAVTFYESWEATPRLIPGVYFSVEECFRSYDKIAAAGGVVLPGHDALVLEHETYPVAKGSSHAAI